MTFNEPWTCWGTGTPLREFPHVDDLGEACVFALERWQPGAEDPPFLNVGTGVDLTIGALAEAVAEATGFRGVCGERRLDLCATGSWPLWPMTSRDYWHCWAGENQLRH